MINGNCAISIKKFILLPIFFLIFILSNTAYAGEENLAELEERLQNQEEVECGVTEYDGNDVVAPRSFSICKEDITYNSLYYLFADVFDDNEILQDALYDDEAITGTETNISGLSGPVMTILNAVTYLIFVVGSIVLSYVTIKYLYRTASTGEMGGNWHSTWVPLRSLLAIMLIAPIGGVSIVQVIVLIAALIAAALGNYLWGAFLNQFQMDFMISSGNIEQNKELGYSQAESLVHTQLCNDRTRKAAREDAFMETDGRGSWLSSYPLTDHMRMLTQCTEESLRFQSGDNDMARAQITGINFGNTNTCYSYGYMGYLEGYQPDIYGEQYNCGGLSFDQIAPEDVIENPKTLSIVEESINSGSGQQGGSCEERYSTVRQINRCKGLENQSDEDDVDYSGIESFVNNAVDSIDHSTKISDLESYAETSLTSNESVNYQSDEIESEIEDMKSTLKQGADNVFKDLQLQGGGSAASRGLFIAYNTVLTNLLGSKIGGDLDGDENIKTRKISSNNTIMADFITRSRLASEELQKTHCLNVFEEKYSTLRENSDALENDVIASDRTFEQWRSEFNLSEVDMECLNFNLTSQEVDVNQLVIAPTILGGGTLSDHQTDLSELVDNYDPNDKTYVSLYKETKSNVVQESVQKAEIKTQALSLWFYVAREATERAFAEVVKDNLDTSETIHMRKRGFAAAGGYLLSIALNQTKISDLVERMRGSVSWYTNLDDTNNWLYTPNYDSEGNDIEDFNSEGVEFSTVDVAGFFDAGGLSPDDIENTSDKLSSDDGSAEDIQGFLGELEDYIFAPTQYLKAAAGIPDNETLREGIRECYSEGNCSTGTTHPLNALIFMGNDLISLSVTMTIITVAVKMANSYVNGDSDNDGGSWVDSLKAVLKSTAGILLGILKGILMTASMILSALLPLWGVLFIAGVFLAYIVPTMPFVAFLLVYIAWVILVVELLIAAPIWLLLLAVPDDNGSARANGMEVWNFFGQLILKPSFMVIAVAFAWFLASVSVFIVNMTVFSVFASISEASTGTIMSIISIMFFYVIYIFIVFIALYQAFKLISSLPDEMSKWINIRQSGDANTVNSMGADRTMQLVLLAKGQQVFSSGMNQAQQEYKQNRNNAATRKDMNQLKSDLSTLAESERNNQNSEPQKDNSSVPQSSTDSESTENRGSTGGAAQRDETSKALNEDATGAGERSSSGDSEESTDSGKDNESDSNANDNNNDK